MIEPVGRFRLEVLPSAILRLCTCLALASCSGEEPQSDNESGLLAQISEESLRQTSRDFTAIGPRYCGTEGEVEAREFVARAFAELGLEVSMHPFGYVLWQPVSLEMELEGPEGGAVPGASLGFSPSTAPEGLIAETIYVGKGQAEDYEKLSRAQTAGRIHLADSSEDTNRTFLYLNAQIHGGVGFVHMKTHKGEAGESLVEVGSVQPFATIPAVAVDKDTRDRLLRNAGRRLTIRALNRTEGATSSNVLGVLRGRSSEFVTVSAHLDSWYVGEGAADDASGIAGMIEVARVLAQGYELERSVHFLAFSAEEMNLQGSFSYVLQNLLDIERRCKLMVELDICGLAGGLALISASPRTLGERALAEAERMRFATRTGSDIEISDELDLGSDLLGYLAIGIPTLYITKTPNLYYHTGYDTLDRIDFRSMRYEVALAAEILAEEAGAVPRPPALSSSPAGG